MQICGRVIVSIVRKVFTGLKMIEPVNLWSV